MDKIPQEEEEQQQQQQQQQLWLFYDLSASPQVKRGLLYPMQTTHTALQVRSFNSPNSSTFLNALTFLSPSIYRVIPCDNDDDDNDDNGSNNNNNL